MVIKGSIVVVWTLAIGLMLAVAVDMGRTWWTTANATDYPMCPAPVEGVACG